MTRIAATAAKTTQTRLFINTAPRPPARRLNRSFPP
jgi:hypothetical protein